MNRIPTEGLKQEQATALKKDVMRLNEQNPDRGIETVVVHPQPS